VNSLDEIKMYAFTGYNKLGPALNVYSDLRYNLNYVLKKESFGKEARYSNYFRIIVSNKC